ncbi:DUF2017 family protein [Luteolibacter marinus]|uniref:DUF2017 family protein n=1 Tax=Luteolibacter marinus TaxID=2776705 RepID=UPI0018691437|nr:DUF2017 family protein [Luteolibacter marinus]
MKVAPTLQGGLRIDVESPVDWMVLRCIPYDARGGDLDLAERVAAPMAGDEGEEDWREFVLPDLRDTFNSQLSTIEDALAEATDEEQSGEVHIAREDAELWYGGLNQARLALEERYDFSNANPLEMTPGMRSAWFRSQFYLHVQSVLLEHVMH